MRKQIFWAVIVMLTGIAMMGANGCDIWADTSATEYQVGDEGITTLHNDETATAYLPGCATFNTEKLVGGTWEDQGPNIECIWEGYVRPLAGGATLDTQFVATEAGTFRLRYVVGWGCTEGVPMSSANCGEIQDVYTNEFAVTQPAVCDYYGKTFNVGDTFPDFEGCNTCRCGEEGLVACTKMGCICNGEEWNRDYKATDPETCEVIRFNCAPHLFYFSNACGCGCQQAPWCEETYDCEPPTDCSFEQTRCPFSTFAL